MFLKRMLNLAGLNAGRKIAENDVLSAYNSLYNKVEVTEFYYKSEAAFKAAAVLHEIKHLNILRIIKIDSRGRKIITEQIQPFSSIFSIRDRKFNRHCAYTLANVISFLHSESKIAHNNISLEALFITSNLNFVLGSFDRSSRRGNFRKDIDDFQKLLCAFNLPHMPMSDILKEETWHSEFLSSMEAFMHEFSVLKLGEKEERICNLVSNVKILPAFYKEKVSEKLVVELRILKEKESSNDSHMVSFKETIAKTALELDPHKDRVLNELFTILDPALRIYILKNTPAPRVSCLGDKAMDSLLLGIRCRDRTIQTLTISLISQGYDGLAEKQRAAFIRSARFLRSREVLGSVCSVLLRHADQAPQVSREACKLMETFLHVKDMCLEVLPLMSVYYKGFSYADICRKVLVVLLELVRHRDSQASAFEAIDLLVLHLKANKDHIIDKEWKLSCIKSFFSQKKAKEHPENNVGRRLREKTALANKEADEDKRECKTQETDDESWADDW